MGGRFRSRNRTHPGMKTFQGGEAKIFALIEGRKKKSTSELAVLLLKSLVKSRKKFRVRINQDTFLVWGTLILHEGRVPPTTKYWDRAKPLVPNVVDC